MKLIKRTRGTGTERLSLIVFIMDVSAIYHERFAAIGLDRRDRVWKVLCRSFFDPLIGPDRVVLDLACGYGEFINNISARKRIAVDLNSDARGHLGPDVHFILSSATNLSDVQDGSIEVVFASNFL